MLKKLVFPILILSIVIQLLVPVGMIAYGKISEENLQKYGKEFKLPVRVSCVQGEYVDLAMDAVWYQNDTNVVIEEDENGFACLKETSFGIPKGDYYIRINDENRSKIWGFDLSGHYPYRNIRMDSAYLVIKVYKGNFEVVQLYMEDIPADEWCEKNIEQTEEDWW